jgi:aminoglycoside phosphotransferase (APT) family kinase protein
MPRELSLPDSVEALTPAWLSQAVAARYPGAVAEAVEVLEAHSGTTGRARLRVRWRSGTSPPEALFAKLAPTDPVQREMVVSTGMGRRESRFYAEVASELPIRVPQPIWAGWNDDGSSYFMLLEDLAEAGCTFPSFRVDDAGEHARGMMDTLADLHGRYWDSPRFADDLAWIEPPMGGPIGPMLVKEAVRQFGGRMPEAFHRLAELYIEHADALNQALGAGTHTLVHGDCHLGNTFVDSGTVGLLDWACVCRAPALRDVAYYLCNSVSVERRRELERPLLERYLARLASAGAEPPDFDNAWYELRRHAVTSWIAATVTAAAGSRMQSLDVGESAMQRTTAAVVDYDTPTLLRGELGL